MRQWSARSDGTHVQEEFGADGVVLGRTIDGALELYFTELGGYVAATVSAETGAITGERTLGTYGQARSLSGAPPVSRGLHGMYEEPDATLLSVGPRHLRRSDGLFLQPDPVILSSLDGIMLQDPYRLQPYRFARNSPTTLEDSSGAFVDTLVDIGFIAYDIYELTEDPHSIANQAALGVDVAFTAIPFATGGGGVVHGVAATNKLRRAENTVARVEREAMEHADDGERVVESLSEHPPEQAPTGGGCFTATATLTTPDRSLPIAEVAAGDLVVTARLDADDTTDIPAAACTSSASPLRHRLSALASAAAVVAACNGPAVAAPGPDALVDAFNGTIGRWEPALVRELVPGDEFIADGQLYAVGDTDLFWLGAPSAEALHRADAAFTEVACHGVATADDQVLVVATDDVTDDATAHHARLWEVADGADVAFDGQLFLVVDGQPQPTGDVLGRVVQPIEHPSQQVIDAVIAYPDGQQDTLTVTANHPFWVDAVVDFVRLGELLVGTTLHTRAGGQALLVSKTWRQGDFTVYNLEVEGLHSYFVGVAGGGDADAVVHNAIADSRTWGLAAPPARDRRHS